MLRRFSLLALIVLVHVGCGSSDGPAVQDVFAPDADVVQDTSLVDTPKTDDLGRADTELPDVVIPEIPVGEDVTIPDVPTDSLPIDTGSDVQVPIDAVHDLGTDVEDDQGVSDVPVDLGSDTFVAEDTGADLYVDLGVDLGVEDTAVEVDVVPQCVENTDCVGTVEISVCHHFVCEVGICVIVADDDGSACTDGEFCTAPDTCQAGICVAGPAVTCNDNNICTADSCVLGACVNTADTSVLSCGLGECYREVLRCSNGVVNTCQTGDSSNESCDGLDNNCNGTTDEGNPGGGAACDSPLFGPCKAGTTVCQSGQVVCVPNVQPVAEKCDNIDNNCDGTIDDGDPSGGLRCETAKLGECFNGVTACRSGIVKCDQVVQPSVEICDGLDNNCDGQADEGNPGGSESCHTGKLGVCDDGRTLCSQGELACIQFGEASAEVCDGVDNDCDGVNDPAGALNCQPFLRDEDADTYGVAGDVQCLCASAFPYTATQAGDCCDTDLRVNEGQTTPFTTLGNCGSFDYNCDETLTLQYNYGVGTCDWQGFLSCDVTAEGWVGPQPSCGEVGDVLTGCGYAFPIDCGVTATKAVTQGCL